MIRIVLFLVILFGSFLIATAQTSKDVKENKAPEMLYESKKSKKKKGFKLFKKKELNDREELEAYRNKMASNQRQKSRELRKADKPQYTDHLYFGHKKPPKKRKNGKKKFCKECGLVH